MNPSDAITAAGDAVAKERFVVNPLHIAGIKPTDGAKNQARKRLRPT